MAFDFLAKSVSVKINKRGIEMVRINRLWSDRSAKKRNEALPNFARITRQEDRDKILLIPANADLRSGCQHHVRVGLNRQIFRAP